MDQAQEQVSVPADSDKLAESLAKFALDVVAAKKAGATGAALIAAAGASVADLIPALSAIGGVGGEISADPLGVAEAFAIAGFKVAQGLKG